MNVDALERLELMRRRLDTDGRVRVAELADELDVSEMTIRRDLDMLVDEGMAQRVRGGAVAVGPQEFDARFRQHARAKARIAEKLVDMVGTGGAIGIDASSTMQRLAARLGEVRDLTVLTNGPDTFRALQDHAGVTALLTGGELDTRTGSLVGPLAHPGCARRAPAPLVRERRRGRPRPRGERVDARGGRGEDRARRVGERGDPGGRRVEARAPCAGPRLRMGARSDALRSPSLAESDSRLDAYRAHVDIV